VNKASGSGNYTLTLNDVKATDGTDIRNDENYRIFVLAVSNSNSSNVLSTAYADIKLSVTSAVGAVKITNVDVKNEEQAAGDATDVTLKYTEPASKVGISRYVLMIAPTGSTFNLSMAKNIALANNSRSVGINGSPVLLSNALLDINGQNIEAGKSYTAYILSESSDNKRASSLASWSAFTINAKKLAQVPVATDVTATASIETGINVSFNMPSGTDGISGYNLYIVKASKTSFDLTKPSGSINTANNFTANLGLNAKDSDGADLEVGKDYIIYVVSVAGNQTTNKNSTSTASRSFTVPTSNTNQGGTGTSNTEVSPNGTDGNSTNNQTSSTGSN
jgi:hypothetical protein